MFDLSFAEITIIAIIALLIIGPEEWPNIIRHVKRIMQTCRNLTREFTKMLEDEELKHTADSLNKDLKTIIDLEGKEQKAYDVSELEDTSKKPLK